MITALFRKAQHNLTLHLSKIQESTTIAHGVNYKKDAYKPATPLPILPLINYEKATYNPPPNTKKLNCPPLSVTAWNEKY